MIFTIPRLTPEGLTSGRLSPASPGTFPQICIRLVALLRLPSDFGASPCTQLSRVPWWDVTPTSTTTDPPPHLRRVLMPYLALCPHNGRFPFPVLSPPRALEDSSRCYHPDYSTLSLTSRARLPVSLTMDSTTWGRWWFAAHPNRALRLPAWREVEPGALPSTFQRAQVIHAVGSLPHMKELGQAAALLGMVGQGVLFPKDETHFRCIHHATSQPSMPSWIHTFSSTRLSGRCCSPDKASCLANSQRLSGYLVYPEGLPVRCGPFIHSIVKFSRRTHGYHYREPCRRWSNGRGCKQ